MRTTVRIEDDLLQELKRRAEAQQLSFNKFLNRILRQGLIAPNPERVDFQQQVYSMGTPSANFDKALAMAADLEDEDLLRKLDVGK